MDPRYQELLQKIDAKSEELSERYRDRMQCKAGCHGCCAPGLTVFPVEAAAISAYLQATGTEAALANEAADPHQGTRCSFLNASGRCLIYPVRPVICRSHGLPLRTKEGGEERRDACPLNFVDENLRQLPVDGILNLDLLNTLLVLINSNFLNGEDHARVPLKASALTDYSVGNP